LVLAEVRLDVAVAWGSEAVAVAWE
jgi:hypothetical protein